jgi:hypothetical protein
MVVPQMGRAAVRDTLLPKPPSARGYAPIGQTVLTEPSDYNSVYVLPGSSDNGTRPATLARAQVWVHSTHNPNPNSPQWIPLVRLSRLENGEVDHAYTSGFDTTFHQLVSNRYQLDGIEGYMYPASGPKPPGTVALLRASRYANRDFAVFPETMMAEMQSQRFTYRVTALGYVYPNTTGIRPTANQTLPEPTLPLAPYGPSPTWAGCYGRNNINWLPASGNEDYYILQKRVWGTPATAWTAVYQGPLTMATTESNNLADIRVRACNSMGCSGWAYGPTAHYFAQCPSP